MKKVHRYTTFAALLAVLIGTTACEDDLNVASNSAITTEDFLKDPNNALQLVTGVYNKQLDYNMYSFSWIGMTSITSDDADKGSSASDTGSDKHKMDNLTFDANDVSFKDIWNGRYDGIYRANNALFYLEQFQIDPQLRNRLIGEVKYLRALYYFDLVRCFGGVPIVTTQVDMSNTALIDEVVFTRRTAEETYAQIELDLTDAIALLPLRAAYGSADLGRASKGAAQGLLAKAYLYQNKYQQAYEAAGEVIASGQYGLLPNYADVWREVGENGVESVYEVQAVVGKGLVDYTNVQGPRGTPDYGWGFNVPSNNLINSYEPGDLRKDGTILTVGTTLWDGMVAPSTWSNPYYNYKAYQSQTHETWNAGYKSNSGKNLRILKYSDILLIRAEAGFHVGTVSETLALVNQLRVRAGLAERSSVTLEEIWKERRWEMAMEHDRWFDLVRTGQAQSAMAAVGKTFIPGKHHVFPIPNEMIIQSGGLLLQNNY